MHLLDCEFFWSICSNLWKINPRVFIPWQLAYGTNDSARKVSPLDDKEADGQARSANHESKVQCYCYAWTVRATN
jgi:hypothetical protein